MKIKICIPVRESDMICCQLQFTLWSLDTTHQRSWSQEFTTVLVYGIIIVYPIIVWRGYTCHATRQNTRVTRRKDRCWLVCKKWENCVRRIETATQSCNHSTETSWASRCRGPRSQLTGGRDPEDRYVIFKWNNSHRTPDTLGSISSTLTFVLYSDHANYPSVLLSIARTNRRWVY